MLSRTAIFIGLHLLCLTKISQPMVIFTANMEDIKKLARRFVSDDMAEKLADLILKASNGVKPAKISEENDKNVNSLEDISQDKTIKTDNNEITKPRKLKIKKKHSKELIYRKKDTTDGVVINVNWDEHTTDTPVERYTKLTKYEKDKEKPGMNNSDDDRFGYRNYRHFDTVPKYISNDGETTDIVATSGPIGLPKLRKTW
ncbi:uncharacterized protein [Choristoneura fumiferana]|uniref:uncharacterized protein n=1 Tax=Choristoneura fumiferana TaxID=7141 RepID=UPI003D15A591